MEFQKKVSDIEKFIKENHLIKKFDGVAPDGFVLVHEKTLEDLKNWFTWEQWRMNKISIEDLNKNNLES